MTRNIKWLIFSAAVAAAIAPAMLTTSQVTFAQTNAAQIESSQPAQAESAQSATSTPTDASQPAQAPVLLEITRKNVYTEIMESEKPAVILITTPDCTDCAELIASLKVQAAKRPYMKFGHSQAPLGRVSPGETPFISIVVPGVGQTYTKRRFAAPVDMDVFMDERIDMINQIMAAKGAVDALQNWITQENKPFVEEGDALRKEEKSIGEPFDQQMAAIIRERDRAIEPLNKQLKEIASRRDALEAASDSTINEIYNRQDLAIADLNTEWFDLARMLETMKDQKDKGISVDDEAIKNGTIRLDTIQREIDEKSKPFVDERLKVKAALWQSMAPLNQESAVIRSNIPAISAPFDERRREVRAQKDEALKVMPAKFADLQARQKAALGYLLTQIEEAEAKLNILAGSEQN